MDRVHRYFFLNVLLNSDSDSSSDSDNDEIIIRGPTVLRPRIRNYFTEVVNAYNEAEFRENFRMNRTTYYHVVHLLRDIISTTELDVGRHTIAAELQVLIALWYFGTPDSYRSICSRFNIGRATALRTIRRVTNALLEKAPNIIIWPEDEYLNSVINGFEQMGFPDTIGSIDGMYVKIPKPEEHAISYINRKNFPSVILQGICDHNLKFTHCYAGEVGSTHDSMVLRRSEVWNYFERNGRFPNNTHIIGDKAYPCIPQLMTPYRDNGHLTDQQRHFNFLLSSARSTIERAFNLLQKRFRCLKDMLEVRSLEWIPKYIIACCVLHNICILKNDILHLDLNFHDDGPELPQGAYVERERVLLGTQKRDRLCHLLYNRI